MISFINNTGSNYKLHFMVIAIYVALTSVMTFPVIVNFSSQFAGIGGDTWAYVWSFWWLQYSLTNSIDPFTTNFMFYPVGTSFTQLTPFNSWLALGLLPIFDTMITWNILWFSTFVFGGYGTFLLARYLHGNFFTSIIAGAIFTFSSYHTAHALGHLELMTIMWIPLFILFLYKSISSRTKINPLIAGFFLFLVTMSSWYYLLFVMIFSIIFLLIKSFTLKEIDHKTYFTNITIIFALGIVISLFFILPSFSFSSNSSFHRPVSEFYTNSLDATNFFIPSSLHTFVQILQIPFFNSAINQISYVGFSVMAILTLALFRIKRGDSLLWFIIAVVFAIFSLGPELKILGHQTGVPLPGKFFYEYVPGWQVFRDPTRFSLMVSLSTAILSSFAISNILGALKSGRRKILINCLILFLVLFEFATIPYPTTAEAIPSIYYTIRDDPEHYAVLEAPIGGSGEVGLLSDPVFQYYQTIHEKPIYSGYNARVPIESQRFVQTYFLNSFVWYDATSDIVRQDLKDVGVSILNYYNIGYVIVHKKIEWYWIQDHITNSFIPDIRKKMTEILGENYTYYENESLIAYKIPKPDSDFPFVILGSGWNGLVQEGSELTRTVEPSSEIIIVNPSKDNLDVKLEMVLKSVGNPHHIVISVNDSVLHELFIPEEKLDVIKDFSLRPGINTVKLLADGYSLEPPFSEYEKEHKVSFKFSSVSLMRIK